MISSGKAKWYLWGLGIFRLLRDVFQTKISAILLMWVLGNRCFYISQYSYAHTWATTSVVLEFKCIFVHFTHNTVTVFVPECVLCRYCERSEAAAIVMTCCFHYTV